MQPIIVIGDKTSHGGTVITCSQTSDTHGKGWARVGDKVACPRCKGIFPIAQGDPTLIDNGQAVAYQGCKVACGATLIAGQQFTLTHSGSTAGAVNVLSSEVGEIGNGLAATYEDELVDGNNERSRGRFQLLDAATGTPVEGQIAHIRSDDGHYFTCSTDAEGFTQWVERDASGALELSLEKAGVA